MAAGAALLLSFAVRPLEVAAPELSLPWWVLALLFCLAELFVVHLYFHREAHSFTFSEVPLILGLFLVDPVYLVLARLLGGSVALALTPGRRQRPIKLVFNLSLFALETCVALVLFHGISRATDGITLGLAALAATVIATVLGILAVKLAILLVSGRMNPRKQLAALGLGVAVTSTNASLALIAVLLVTNDPRSLWALAVIGAALYFSYRAYTSLVQKHEDLELLYESSTVAQQSLDAEPVLLALLSQGREMFRAELAEIMLFDRGRGGAPILSTMGADGGVELMEAADPTWAESLRERIGSRRQGFLVQTATEDEELRLHLEARCMTDVMIAPLHRGSAVVGAFLVANRLGDVATFTSGDLRFFETFANQAGAALENSRLVGEIREQADHHEHLALHDSLTGLPNRVFFYERLREALRDAPERGGMVAVLMMDLDRFKEVNDTLGHGSGDRLLVAVASRLAATAGDDATVARLGGDEFALLLSGISDLHEAVGAAERVLGTLAEPFDVHDLTLEVGASVGIALYPEHGGDADMLIQRADVAMYLAKEAQTGHEFYEPDRDHYSARRLTLVGELRSALESGDITIRYQPKADLRTGRTVGVEALVRWLHPRRGPVAVEEFIPMAEGTGLIRPLTMYVINEALRQARAWREEGIDLPVAVNLSARCFTDSLCDDIEALLARWDSPGSSLELEITESGIMADPARAANLLARIAVSGVRIAVDDFGTGYSSLGYLSRLPIHEIKIDKSFVIGMLTSEEDHAIVHSTIELGHNLGLTVVAEGVENEQAWNQLAELGCDIAQGFLLSRPLLGSEFSRWLALRAVSRPDEQRADVVMLSGAGRRVHGRQQIPRSSAR